MADIELVIKIPEEIYKASKIIDVQYEDVVQIPLEVIANSIPLDKIRAEIASYGTNSGMLLALEIIDKYRGGADETNN